MARSLLICKCEVHTTNGYKLPRDACDAFLNCLQRSPASKNDLGMAVVDFVGEEWGAVDFAGKKYGHRVSGIVFVSDGGSNGQTDLNQRDRSVRAVRNNVLKIGIGVKEPAVISGVRTCMFLA